MLRSPPTQISLHPSETADWVRKRKEDRLQRQPQAVKRCLRLDNGPRHLAQPGIVLEDDNVGRKRAESCSSEATICSDLDELHLDSPTTPDDVSSSNEGTADSSQPTETEEIADGVLEQRTTHCTEHVPGRLYSRVLVSDQPITSDCVHVQSYDGASAQDALQSLNQKGEPLDFSSAGKVSASNDHLSPVASTPGIPKHDDYAKGGRINHNPNLHDKDCSDQGKIRTSHFGPPISFPQRTSSRQHLIEYERLSIAAGARIERLTHSGDLNELSDSNSTDVSTYDLGDIIQIRQRRDRRDSHSGVLAGKISESCPHKSDGTPSLRQHHQQTPCMHEFDATDESILLRDSPLSELTQCLSQISAERPRSIDELRERFPGECNAGSLSNPFTEDIESIRRANHGDQSRVGYGSTSSCGEGVGPLVIPSRGLRMGSPPQSPEILPYVPRDSPKLSTASRNRDAGSSPGSPQYPTPRRANRGGLGAAHTRHDTVVSIIPKVSVYDDSLPPGIQPRTPADIVRHSHRVDQTYHRDSPHHGPVVSHMSSAKPLGDGSSSTEPRQRTKPLPNHDAHTDTSNEPRSTHSSQQSQVGFVNVSTHGEAQGIPEHTENDIWASMQQLQHDRRTRALREGTGDLETTPPREGRFERYFSC